MGRVPGGLIACGRLTNSVAGRFGLWPRPLGLLRREDTIYPQQATLTRKGFRQVGPSGGCRGHRAVREYITCVWQSRYPGQSSQARCSRPAVKGRQAPASRAQSFGHGHSPQPRAVRVTMVRIHCDGAAGGSAPSRRCCGERRQVCWDVVLSIASRRFGSLARMARLHGPASRFHSPETACPRSLSSRS